MMKIILDEARKIDRVAIMRIGINSPFERLIFQDQGIPDWIRYTEGVPNWAIDAGCD